MRYFLPSVLMTVALIATTIGFTSCESAGEEPEPSKKMDYALLVNSQSNDSTYDLALFSAKGGIAFLTLDENDRITREDILIDNAQTKLSVNFYDNGLVKSISNDEGSIVFSNYSGNKVDIAMIGNDGSFEIATECEGQYNWDEVLNQAARAPRRAFADDVADFGDEIRDFNEKNEWLYFAIDCMGGLNALRNHPTQEIDAEFLRDLGLWGYGMGTGVVDIASDNVYFESSLFAADLALAIKYSNLWGIAWTLFENYDKVEDFFTAMWLKFFEWRDSLNQDENTDLGLAALNSGMGALKITLAWNFYADIDLHVIEPDGNHIYYGNTFSWSSDGYLDVDNRRGGAGANENIYWEHPENGVYHVYLNYFSESTYNDMAQRGNCKVTILYKGSGNVYNIPMNAEGETKSVADIELPAGRLNAPASQETPRVMLHLVPKPRPDAQEMQPALRNK